MFDFKVLPTGEGQTMAYLDDYEISFFASSRNTRVIGTIGKNDDGEEYRASGSLFYHYDARAQGQLGPNGRGNDCDTGSRGFDCIRD